MMIVLAWLSLGVAFTCAALIINDILGGGFRQKMAIMEIVWPVTALYLGPFALYGYWRWGRVRSERWERANGPTGDRPIAVAAAVAVSHCGAGCTIGDIVGSSLVFALGLKLAGLGLWFELPVDFIVAFALGIVFQYLTIAPMRHLGVRAGIVAALKADTLSLIAFEVGLFGWMILMQLVLYPVEHVHPNEPTFWFLMQVGMALGFLTAYPVNWWLVRHGLKERM